MLHSLSAQVSYYSAFIQRHPGWQYCGVYADEALTGTKEARDGFQRLLTDCRNGQIDLVITKSISRFARNTVTLLETVRELKALGVDVFFEEQNLHSISTDGELMITILASYAQEESLSASENQKWRVRKSFENGEYEGLGLIPGEVVSFKGAIDSKLKIPQIGWNSLIFSKNREKSRLYKYTDEGAYVYFVHSYYASSCDDFVSAYTQYGINITASAEKGSIYAVQYHPEKSGKTGLKILQAFCEI
ncbi:MAG: Imidazole glycerol phosphate synthase subunit HisH 1 [Firmicutes bacterium ADurb.Bin300]|nr:MAG: Imidazole glycerol phosphate synthase subunit HisH 1 [Firmicutes bacterium ADurb.Bin300]